MKLTNSGIRHFGSFERRDVIIVASVSCIYSLGDPSITGYGRIASPV